MGEDDQTRGRSADILGDIFLDNDTVHGAIVCHGRYVRSSLLSTLLELRIQRTQPMEMLRYAIHDSPIGKLRIVCDTRAVRAIRFEDGNTRHTLPKQCVRGGPLCDRVVAELEEYFAGQRRSFDLPLAPKGTSFQQQVWRALLKIPYGETTTYGELARRIKRPNASRAVGAANGSNPISIVIPCHRVLGSNAALTGYGGGLEAKQRLLALEGGAIATR